MLETIIITALSVLMIQKTSNYVLYNNCCYKMNIYDEEEYDSDEEDEDEYNYNTYVKYDESDDDILLLESDVGIYFEYL